MRRVGILTVIVWDCQTTVGLPQGAGGIVLHRLTYRHITIE